MYLDVVTKIPDLPGKIICRKVSGTTYVYYQYGQQYDPARRFSIPQRTTIGKLNADGLLIPNENFHKYITGENLPGEKPRSVRSSCLRIGVHIILRKIIADYQLEDFVSSSIGQGDTGFLLDLAAYSIISENNAGQYYPDYAFNHPLFTSGMKMYSDARVSSFLNSITDGQTSSFLNSWNEKRNHRERIYISYDATNKNCQAGDIEMAEYGHAKDDRSKPVFNYSLSYDHSNREPLYYEEYPGSIVDVSQLQCSLDKAMGYGYKNVGFILDRGYFCKENIRYLDKCNYSFVMMVKGVKALVSELILSTRGSFETNRDCHVREYKAYGKTVKARLYADDDKERFFHIYYTPGRAHAEREQFEARIEALSKYLKKQEGKKRQFGDSIRDYFTLEYAGDKETFLFARERKDVVERELMLGGYFAIVTSEEMTAGDALTLYKSRDESEKLFRGDKSYLGNKAARVYSDESASAKIFIEFIALILRNKLYTYLKSAVLKNEKKANYMTVPAAIRELEKVEMIRLADGIYRLDHAVTATQKEILSAFGLNEDFVKQEAKRLSEELANLK